MSPKARKAKAKRPSSMKRKTLKKKSGKIRPKKKAKPLSKLDKSIKAHTGEINELIERGRPRGFVTDNEILYYFPKIEDNVGLFDEIYDRLEKAGIKVIETSALIDFSKDDDRREYRRIDGVRRRCPGCGADVFEGDRQDAVAFQG